MHVYQHILCFNWWREVLKNEMCKFSNKLKQPLFGSFQGKPAAAKSLQSCPTLCEPWTVACQALRFKGFYRQEYMEKKKKRI